MITVLLVDNDAKACKSLIQEIEWNTLQLHLLDHVSCEREAMQYMDKTVPDILILDLAAASEPGTDLIRYLYDRRMQIKLLILSEKPGKDGDPAVFRLPRSCGRQLLNDTLRSIAAECKEEKKDHTQRQYLETFIEKSKPQLREKLLLDILHGKHINEENLVKRCAFLGLDVEREYYVVAAEIDNAKEVLRPMGEEQKDAVTQEMLAALTASVSNRSDAELLTVAEGYYALLIPKRLAGDIFSACEAVREHFYNETTVSATFGIGGAPVKLPRLNEAYTKACETLTFKYIAGNNTVIRYEDVSVTTVNEKHLVNTIALQTQIIQAVRTGDEETVGVLCRDWFAQLESSSPPLIKSLIIQFIGTLSIQLYEIGISVTEVFGDENLVIEKALHFDTFAGVKRWMREILQRICEYVREKNQKRTCYLAKKAARYIDDHYMEDINVENIANVVFLSSGYLMTIFKKEIGCSIISYLTNRRIERAKELLLENNLKIYEIAERVGYSNSTFFSSTFRSHVGVSPKHFKELHAHPRKDQQ